jgi:predicted porin
MRKYLLASAALFGLAAGGAQAATFAPSDPGANSSAFGAPQTNPDPGKIIVRLGGRVIVDAAVIATDADVSHVNNAKNQAYGMAGYFRLYFGVDGKMTNGMIYGANAEMRTIFAGQAPPGITTTGAIANASANTNGSLWFTRRAYVYFGGDNFGIIRIGQGDGPLSLFNGNSTGEFYSTGQWDGDACDLVSNGCVAWFFPVVGNEYDSNKITWVSPKWAGFSLGLSFAPSSAALSANGGSTAIAGGDQRQSTGVLTDAIRPRNIFEIAGRYQGTLGPVGLDAMIGYSGSGVVNTATLQNGSGVSVLPATGVSKFQGLSVFDAGLTASMSGFQVFGHVTTGKMNGAFTPQAKLISGRSKDGLAYTFGAAYGQGPWIVGASWYVAESLGAVSATGNRFERGFSVGGTYALVPGVDLFLEYLYGTRHQRGMNFRDGAFGSPTNSNTINTNMLLTAVQVRW